MTKLFRSKHKKLKKDKTKHKRDKKHHKKRGIVPLNIDLKRYNKITPSEWNKLNESWIDMSVLKELRKNAKAAKIKPKSKRDKRKQKYIRYAVNRKLIN